MIIESEDSYYATGYEDGAAAERERCATEIKQLREVANQGISIEAQLRKEMLLMQVEIEQLHKAAADRIREISPVDLPDVAATARFVPRKLLPAAIEAGIRADRDATLFGAGYIKILPDGTPERIDPRTIFFKSAAAEVGASQAQIDAARKAYWDAGGDSDSDLPWKAALTAAATQAV